MLIVTLGTAHKRTKQIEDVINRVKKYVFSTF